jgi:hypothetical protein
MARPSKVLSEKSFRAMCRYQCTQSEICSFLEVSDKTLTDWCQRTFGESFSVVYKKFSEGGFKSLRRAMWHKAVVDKNTGMMIWLSKNYLGMVDKIEKENEGHEPFIIETTNGEITLGIRKKEVKKDDE